MQAPAIAFVTPASAPRWKRWLVYSPLARIVYFAVIFIALGIGVSDGFDSLGWTAKTASSLHRGFAGLCEEIIPPLLAYLFVVRWIERRRALEMSPRAIPTLGLAGLLGGSALFSAVVGVLWLAGSYHVTGTNAHPDWIPEVLVAGIGAGIGEEIITRGALFRMVEEGMGTWWALAISAAFFGLAHIANPGATLWSSAAIAIEAGLLFGMLYHVTRSLWPCVGLHASWNIMQGTVYGIPVSGTHAEGFLVSYRTGPDWLSGGVFGAEASVVALALCSMVTLALLAIALRRGSIVPPSWKRITPPEPDGRDRLDKIR
jgi:membrane protease YdiL (CAAX protease family)